MWRRLILGGRRLSDEDIEQKTQDKLKYPIGGELSKRGYQAVLGSQELLHSPAMRYWEECLRTIALELGIK